MKKQGRPYNPRKEELLLYFDKLGVRFEHGW